MYGELIGAWNFSGKDIWSQIAKDADAPDDIFLELYPELIQSLRRKPKFKPLAERSNNPTKAKQAFMRVRARSLKGERSAIEFLERAYTVFVEYGNLAETYFQLTRRFIDKYNLRYDLQRPYRLCPTWPAMFGGLVRELHAFTERDPHLASMLSDFEHALGDLTFGITEGRIKTCIQKQVNLLEAIGQVHPAIGAGATLGVIADGIKTWPHDSVRESLKKLYGFTSNYPGIRHGGNPTGIRRPIDMRDMIAMSILMAGFTPYLADGLNADLVYGVHA